MTDPKGYLLDLSVPDFYRHHLVDILDKIRWGTNVKILVVVDTEISTSPGVGFGIQRVIELIRATTVGCMSFTVDIAQRSPGAPAIVAAPAPFAPKYTGFRFDMKDSDGTTPVVNRYAQIWSFGFKPDNSGGPDSNITQPGALPASDAELAVLASWMNDRKGGMFATGDHDYLGASMCHRIPRVRTMRRWTNADGVPPIGTQDRIDTLRPGTEPLANTPHQGDTVPQPIQWVAWSKIRVSWYQQKVRPHPVLCHPTLGPIDVMPDHAHEGLCFDTPDVNVGGSFNFDGAGNKPEYPANSSGTQPRPVVIAYGSTLGSPPTVFEKGPQHYRPKFPMISVYDGHSASVGRVAVDSTWHHWMNVNIDNIATAGGNNWEKIKRYYINLAVWLNPPGYTTKCFLDFIYISHFGYPGLQEYSPRLSDIELGSIVRQHLEYLWGPCWVTQFVLDHLFEINPKWHHMLSERFLEQMEIKPPRGPKPPFPDPCLTCPPLDVIENSVLGGIVRETLKPAAEMRAQLESEKGAGRVDFKVLEKAALQGARTGLFELGKLWQESLNQSQDFFKRLQ